VKLIVLNFCVVPAVGVLIDRGGSRGVERGVVLSALREELKSLALLSFCVVLVMKESHEEEKTFSESGE